MTNAFKLFFQSERNNITQEFQVEITLHKLKTDKIILIVPGVDGSVDGYKNKYVKLANYLTENGIGAVVRMSNPYAFGFGWDLNLRQVLTYILENTNDICGSDKPDIYIMGISAGAGAAAMIAWEYPEIKKLLLMEPAWQVGPDEIKQNLSKFEGELYVVVGSGDEALGEKMGRKFIEHAPKTKHKEFYVIPNCDHHFSGSRNSKIFSQAPVYAFTKAKHFQFPDYSEGVELY